LAFKQYRLNVPHAFKALRTSVQTTAPPAMLPFKISPRLFPLENVHADAWVNATNHRCGSRLAAVENCSARCPLSELPSRTQCFHSHRHPAAGVMKTPPLYCALRSSQVARRPCLAPPGTSDLSDRRAIRRWCHDENDDACTMSHTRARQGKALSCLDIMPDRGCQAGKPATRCPFERLHSRCCCCCPYVGASGICS
jgi:hypothetical protein